MTSLSKKNSSKTQKLSFTANDVKLFSYVGSKLKYKKHYDSLLTNIEKKEYKVYIEAFAGSLASLFHNLEHIKADKIIINDFNPRIINLYEQIKSNPQEVFEKYLILENEFNRIVPQFIKDKYKSNIVKEQDKIYLQEVLKFYLDAKEVFDNSILDTNNAALFIFIMKHSFSGRYRENKKGKLTTSFNWKISKINIKQIELAIMNLHNFFNSNNVEFENLDAFELVDKYNESDTFIYLDPPYSTSTIQYGNGKRANKKVMKQLTFNEVELHKKLLDVCNKYECVMYSNHFEEEFIESFDNHTTFKRSNTIGTEKIEESKLEILAIKVNIIIPILEKAKPIVELLGLASPLEGFKIIGKSATSVLELLSIEKNEINNCEYKTETEIIA